MVIRCRPDCDCDVTEFVCDCGQVDQIVHCLDRAAQDRFARERREWYAKTFGDPLRPMPEHSMSRMTTIRNILTKTLLFTAIIVGIAMMLAAGRAEAHLLTYAPCDIAWQKAPPGHKWEAKAACIHAVRAHNKAHMCQKPRVVPSFVTVKHERVDAEQKHVLRWILEEGRRRRLRRVTVLAAIVATTQESSARELAGGDGSSAGPFQLIDIHGSAADRQTVEFSGNWFYNGAAQVLAGNSTISAPDLAQAVERSAYPYAYQQWLTEARWTIKRYSGPCIYYRR